MVIDFQISEEARKIIDSVPDPEIPVLTITDLGMVREAVQDGREIRIKLTPTYSGCPAMDTIQSDIRKAFTDKGFNVTIELTLDPAWTTDWITAEGKEKLYNYGIAPPENAVNDKKALLSGEKIVKCPNCGSEDTSVVSQFGSTPCKSLFKCNHCLEPFDYFKCH